MRKARKYDRIVKVFAQSKSTDGFGGELLSGAQIAASWASIETIKRDRLQDYGLDQNRQSIKVYLRHRNDLDFTRPDIYLQYAGKDYMINSVTEVNERRVVYEIIATNIRQEAQASAVETFDNTFDTTFR